MARFYLVRVNLIDSCSPDFLLFEEGTIQRPVALMNDQDMRRIIESYVKEPAALEYVKGILKQAEKR